MLYCEEKVSIASNWPVLRCSRLDMNGNPLSLVSGNSMNYRTLSQPRSAVQGINENSMIKCYDNDLILFKRLGVL